MRLHTCRATGDTGGSARIGLPALLLASAMLLTACASTPPPTGQLAVSEAAISRAVTAGGSELAPVEMTGARDKLARASLAMSDENYELARSLAQAAEVDAQLAEARANAVKATRVADELRESTRVLREELQRSSK